jgi:hypothetical protein
MRLRRHERVGYTIGDTPAGAGGAVPAKA